MRSCGSSQDGSLRPGDNLFANTLVAVDMKTGAYKWHFQSIHHDVWDMDNTHPPVLADIKVGGQTTQGDLLRQQVGHHFVLDRTNGKPVLGVVEQADQPVDSRQRNAADAAVPGAGRLAPEVPRLAEARSAQHPGRPVARGAELQRLPARRRPASSSTPSRTTSMRTSRS